jgi:hypothetical protein
MEIIGIVLLLGLFGLGVGFVYLFLQYIDLLKSIKAINENIAGRLKALEEKIDAQCKPESAAPAKPDKA